MHNKTYHDYPSYTGSYSRSLSTVSNLLKNTKADIIIDIHRDAIGSYSSYAPTVKIGEDECAQLMFVIGTDGGKLKHPNWKSNLQYNTLIELLVMDDFSLEQKTSSKLLSKGLIRIPRICLLIKMGFSLNSLILLSNLSMSLSTITNTMSSCLEYLKQLCLMLFP